MPTHTALIGPPGTGKTTAGTMVAKRWFRSGLGPEDVAYLAFTKAAAHEAGRRMLDESSAADVQKKLPYFRTIHSLAYRSLKKDKPDVRLITTSDMKGFAKVTGFEGAYMAQEWEDLAEVYQRLENKGRTNWDRALTAYTLSRISAQSAEDLERSRHHISRTAMRTIDFLPEDIYVSFVEKYERYKDQEGLIDFPDMLEYALTEMRPLPVKKVVIDECQDLSAALFSISDRLFADAEEIWMAGDPDQCQPAGTMVDLPGRKRKAIEDIVPGDQVVAYDRRGGEMCGTGNRNAKGATVARVGHRSYSGPLFRISAGSRSTEATLEHRFLVRWTPEIRKSKMCVTYLMERDGLYRVGWCQLFREDAVLHVLYRANIEKAKRIWILKTHEDRTDASIHESVIAARYGIPTAPFEPPGKHAIHMTREAIDQIFSEVGDRREQASRCLADHGRSIDWPFSDRKRDKARKRTTILELEACNILPGLMAVPLNDGIKKARWEPVSVSVQEVKNIPVFSLEVQKHHTYVADGIVSHNCVYGFAAAKASLFINRVRKANRRIFLRQTHRFGQEIVDFSEKIIKRVRDRIPREVWGLPGRKHDIRFTGDFKPMVAPMLILHRHVMGCQALAEIFVQEGLPFRNERGKDPLGYRLRVTAFETLCDLAAGKRVAAGAIQRVVEDVIPSTHMNPDTKESVRIIVHGGKKRLQEGLGKEPMSLGELTTKKIFTEKGADLIRMKSFDVLKYRFDMMYYQRVVDNGYSLDSKNIPRISTLHGAKGREAPMVVLFTETGKKCWDDEDAEHRLAFVGATRTQGELEICSDRTLDWANNPYPYPERELPWGPIPDEDPFA